MPVPSGWVMTENGWTWIGPGPQPGVDPFHSPAATAPGGPASLYYDDRAGDLQNMSKVVTNTADDSGFYVPDWLKNQGGALTPTSQAGGQEVSSYAHTPSGGGMSATPDYYYNTTNLLDKSGGFSPYANPDLWTRIANDPAWQQAMATGNYAALNGHKTYDVLDRNGNVVDTRTFENLDNGDSYDQIVMALVGMGFGAAAAGAMAAGGTAAGTTGTGAATTVGTTGATGATGTVGAGGASFGLSPSVLTAPTVAEGAGLTSTASTGGLFANPAMWSGAVPAGVSYGIAPTLGAAAGGAAGAGSGGAVTGTAPPANPYAWQSYTNPTNLANLATSGSGTSNLASLGSTALSALSGKGASTPDLSGDEAAREAKLQAAIDAINERFGYGTTPAAATNKTARDSMYSDISGAVSDAAMRDLNKQFTTASNRNTFGLARSGLLGGSVDAESGGDLKERYGEGTMKATQQGLGAASDLRSQDEQTRQKLVSLAQSGLDVGTANSMAASELQASADSARANAPTASVGRLFDDMSQAYAVNGYMKARYPNGVGTSAPTGYGSNLFGTTRYTGRVQG